MPLRKNIDTTTSSKAQSYSTYCKDYVFNSGITTLDYYLGGGFVTCSLVLLEDSGFRSTIARSFIQSSVRTGSESSDEIVLIGSCHGLSDQFFMEEKSEDSNNATLNDGPVKDILKIAWRYQHIPIEQTHDKTEKLTQNLPKNVIELNSYKLGLSGIREALERLSAGSNNKPLRIILYDFGAPTFLQEKSHYLELAYFLKSFMLRTNAVCIIDASTRGSSNVAVIPRLRHLSDYHFTIVSFDQVEKDIVCKNSLFTKDHIGFVTVFKVPHISNAYPQLLEDNKFGIKKRRDVLILERLHLPPELSETPSRSEVKVVSNCGSSPSHANKEAW